MERKKTILRILFVMVATLVIQACAHPMFYTAQEFSGKVVDADTDMPIEGVAIVAKWIPYQIRPVEGRYYGVMEVEEAVTDKDGKYTMPGWGPRMRMPLTYLDNYDPEIWLYKKGYVYAMVDNVDPEIFYKYFDKEQMDKLDFQKFKDLVNGKSDSFASKKSRRVSIWDGKIIKLKKFGGQPIEEHYTDIIDMQGKVVKRERTVIDDNARLDSMLSTIYDCLLDGEKGIPLEKVKHMVHEYVAAKKEVKRQPP